MAEKRFEVGLTLPFDLTDHAGAAVLVERLGFDYLAIGEHVAFHGPVANAFVVLSHAAAVTERIKLLSAVTLAPLYPAVLLAKLAAMTDVVSRGRFELGVGVGGEYPPEFVATGVSARERGARTDEALQIVRALWPGDPVSHRGRFWRFDDLSLAPAPPSQPGPRIWIAGRAAAAIRRVVRAGDVWMPYMYTPEQLAGSVAEVRGALADAGRDPGSVAVSINCFVTVGTDAERVAAAKVGDTYRQDFTGTRRRYLVAGTAQDCVARLREYADAGAGSAIVTLACPTADWGDMARTVARDILPALPGRSRATEVLEER